MTRVASKVDFLMFSQQLLLFVLPQQNGNSSKRRRYGKRTHKHTNISTDRQTDTTHTLAELSSSHMRVDKSNLSQKERNAEHWHQTCPRQFTLKLFILKHLPGHCKRRMPWTRRKRARDKQALAKGNELIFVYSLGSKWRRYFHSGSGNVQYLILLCLFTHIYSFRHTYTRTYIPRVYTFH